MENQDDGDAENDLGLQNIQTDNPKIIKIKDFLERELIHLPPQNTEKESKCYIAGIIQCLENFKTLSESEANELYLEYVG